MAEKHRQQFIEHSKFYYRMACLSVCSQLPLPELNEQLESAASKHEPSDIEVVLGNVPVNLSQPLYKTPFYQLDRDNLLLQLPGIAGYLVENGQKVTIQPAKEASERDIRLFLLGSVFGTLCHQRGLFALHASAIEFNGRAYAFAGSSGAGKSTLAAALQKQGHRLLGDDICVIAQSGKQFLLYPDMPRLKLWGNSLEYLGLSDRQQQLTRVRQGVSKYYLPQDKHKAEPIPLKSIYILGEASDTPNIEQLFSLDAIGALTQNVYRTELLEQMGRGNELFEGSSKIATDVPVFRFHRPWGLSDIKSHSAFLVKHWNTN